MPFGRRKWNEGYPDLGDLVRQADEAFDASDRLTCLMLICEIYALLDAASADCIMVESATVH